MRAEQHSCIILNGVPGNTIENISLSDVHLTFGGGGTAEDAARRELPLIANEYFSLGPMPAYGLYARNARGVTLSNVRFTVATPDMRPALILDNVHDASIVGLAADGHPVHHRRRRRPFESREAPRLRRRGSPTRREAARLIPAPSAVSASHPAARYRS